MKLTLTIAVAFCALASAFASNYDSYEADLAKRNQDLHEDFLRSHPAAQDFFRDYDNHVNNLQAQHYIKDSQYPNNFDVDSYWNDFSDLVGQEKEGASEDPEEADRIKYWTNVINELSDAQQRREEEPYMNKIWGEQKVSGGSGESGQVTGPENFPSKSQVKTDRLPSYCDPPNPCPLGYDPQKLAAPCDPDVKDTAKYNYNATLEKMSAGECPCDDEHMMCPHGASKVSQIRSSGQASSRNPFLSGSKRDDHEAKKHSHVLIEKRGVHANFVAKVSKKKNPWLDGVDTLETVQKKAGPIFDPEEPIM